jgi:hypothetical protein
VLKVEAWSRLGRYDLARGVAEWKWVIVVGGFEVDPVALHVGSDRMCDAVGEAVLDFVGYEEGLAGAAPGWVGSSQLALGELAARWEVRHSQHKLRMGGLGSHVAEAMVSFVANEDGSARAFRSVGELG